MKYTAYLCVNIFVVLVLDAVALKLIPSDRNVIKTNGKTHIISKYYVVPNNFDISKGKNVLSRSYRTQSSRGGKEGILQGRNKKNMKYDVTINRFGKGDKTELSVVPINREVNVKDDLVSTAKYAGQQHNNEVNVPEVTNAEHSSNINTVLRKSHVETEHNIDTGIVNKNNNNRRDNEFLKGVFQNLDTKVKYIIRSHYEHPEIGMNIVKTIYDKYVNSASNLQEKITRLNKLIPVITLIEILHKAIESGPIDPIIDGLFMILVKPMQDIVDPRFAGKDVIERIKRRYRLVLKCLQKPDEDDLNFSTESITEGNFRNSDSDLGSDELDSRRESDNAILNQTSTNDATKQNEANQKIKFKTTNILENEALVPVITPDEDREYYDTPNVHNESNFPDIESKENDSSEEIEPAVDNVNPEVLSETQDIPDEYVFPIDPRVNDESYANEVPMDNLAPVVYEAKDRPERPEVLIEKEVVPANEVMSIETKFNKNPDSDIFLDQSISSGKDSVNDVPAIPEVVVENENTSDLHNVLTVEKNLNESPDTNTILEGNTKIVKFEPSKSEALIKNNNNSDDYNAFITETKQNESPDRHIYLEDTIRPVEYDINVSAPTAEVTIEKEDIPDNYDDLTLETKLNVNPDTDIFLQNEINGGTPIVDDVNNNKETSVSHVILENGTPGHNFSPVENQANNELSPGDDIIETEGAQGITGGLDVLPIESIPNENTNKLVEVVTQSGKNYELPSKNDMRKDAIVESTLNEKTDKPNNFVNEKSPNIVEPRTPEVSDNPTTSDGYNFISLGSSPYINPVISDNLINEKPTDIVNPGAQDINDRLITPEFLTNNKFIPYGQQVISFGSIMNGNVDVPNNLVNEKSVENISGGAPKQDDLTINRISDGHNVFDIKPEESGTKISLQNEKPADDFSQREYEVRDELPTQENLIKSIPVPNGYDVLYLKTVKDGVPYVYTTHYKELPQYLKPYVENVYSNFNKPETKAEVPIENNANKYQPEVNDGKEKDPLFIPDERFAKSPFQLNKPKGFIPENAEEKADDKGTDVGEQSLLYPNVYESASKPGTHGTETVINRLNPFRQWITKYKLPYNSVIQNTGDVNPFFYTIKNRAKHKQPTVTESLKDTYAYTIEDKRKRPKRGRIVNTLPYTVKEKLGYDPKEVKEEEEYDNIWPKFTIQSRLKHNPSFMRLPKIKRERYIIRPNFKTNRLRGNTITTIKQSPATAIRNLKRIKILSQSHKRGHGKHLVLNEPHSMLKFISDRNPDFLAAPNYFETFEKSIDDVNKEANDPNPVVLLPNTGPDSKETEDLLKLESEIERQNNNDDGHFNVQINQPIQVPQIKNVDDSELQQNNVQTGVYPIPPSSEMDLNPNTMFDHEINVMNPVDMPPNLYTYVARGPKIVHSSTQTISYGHGLPAPNNIHRIIQQSNNEHSPNIGTYEINYNTPTANKIVHPHSYENEYYVPAQKIVHEKTQVKTYDENLPIESYSIPIPGSGETNDHTNAFENNLQIPDNLHVIKQNLYEKKYNVPAPTNIQKIVQHNINEIHENIPIPISSQGSTYSYNAPIPIEIVKPNSYKIDYNVPTKNIQSESENDHDHKNDHKNTETNSYYNVLMPNNIQKNIVESNNPTSNIVHTITQHNLNENNYDIPEPLNINSFENNYITPPSNIVYSNPETKQVSNIKYSKLIEKLTPVIDMKPKPIQLEKIITGVNHEPDFKEIIHDLPPTYALLTADRLLKLRQALLKKILSGTHNPATANLYKINTLLLKLAKHFGGNKWYLKIFYPDNEKRHVLENYVRNLLRQQWLHELMIILTKNNLNLNVLQDPRISSILNSWRFPQYVIDAMNLDHPVSKDFTKTYGARNILIDNLKGKNIPTPILPANFINAYNSPIPLNNKGVTSQKNNVHLSITGVHEGVDAYAIAEIVKKYLQYKKLIEHEEDVINNDKQREMFKQVLLLLREKGYGAQTIAELLRRLYAIVTSAEGNKCNNAQKTNLNNVYDIIVPVLRRR